MLLTTAFIWGTAFVAQRDGMKYVGPFTFNGLRCYVAFFSLLLVILAFNKITKNFKEKASVNFRGASTDKDTKNDKKNPHTGRNHLWCHFVHSQHLATIRSDLYNCGKGRLYNDFIYRPGSPLRHVFRKKSSPSDLDLRSFGNYRAISAFHQRRF